MTYTDVVSLADYLSVDENDLPDDVDRMIERASQYIDFVTRNRISPYKDRHLDTAEIATNAQIEYWLQTGDEVGILQAFDSVDIGQVSLRKSEKLPELAPRAYQILFLEGLVSNNVVMR